ISNHSFQSMAIVSSPSSISNYFSLFAIDESTAKSDPPHLFGGLLDRVYGGMLLYQTAKAFITLHPDLVPHYINYNFSAPANSKLPLQFKLSSDDGTIAKIIVSQNKKTVGIGHVRYSNVSDFLDSSLSISPDCEPPERYASFDLRQLYLLTTHAGINPTMGAFPIEARPIENGEIHRTTMWVRITPENHGSLKNTDGLPVLFFLSDCTMFFAAFKIFERSGIRIDGTASLHHSVRIHEANLDPFGWYLADTECELISHGRALQRSRIFDASRKCVLTVVQEGFLQRENKL
ncbi:hypothetical protein PMAYCL1PPCAC_30321, partial [Pristionchus mayeri]